MHDYNVKLDKLPIHLCVYVLTKDYVACIHVRFFSSLPLIFTLLVASISHFLTTVVNRIFIYVTDSCNEMRLLCFFVVVVVVVFSLFLELAFSLLSTSV